MKKYKVCRRYTAFGSYLQKSRIAANLTQREVSLELGYSSAQFISNFERGIAVPPLKKMKILIRRYRLDTNVVIDGLIAAERSHMRSILVGKR